MRFMILVKSDEATEAGTLPDASSFGEMNAYNERLVDAGVMLAAEGLQPSSKGVRVRFDGGERTVIEGPFTGAKDLVAGFWLWQAQSKDEAIEWLKRAPFGGGVEIELRPVMELEDFGDAVTPEVKAREERLRARSEKSRQSS